MISVSALIHFDAVVTDAVDLIRISAESSGNGIRIFQIDNELLLTIQEMRLTISNRGGTVPRNNLQGLKLILPIITSNHLSECYEIYSRFRALCTEREVVDLSVRGEAIIEDRPNYISREDKVCFKMPDTGRYCIELSMHVFTDYICD